MPLVWNVAFLIPFCCVSLFEQCGVILKPEFRKKEIDGRLLCHTHGLEPKYGAGNRFFSKNFFPGHFLRRIHLTPPPPRQESFIIIVFSISYNCFTTFPPFLIRAKIPPAKGYCPGVRRLAPSAPLPTRNTPVHYPGGAMVGRHRPWGLPTLPARALPPLHTQNSHADYARVPLPCAPLVRHGGRARCPHRAAAPSARCAAWHPAPSPCGMVARAVVRHGGAPRFRGAGGDPDAAPCTAIGGARRRPRQNSQRVLLVMPTAHYARVVRTAARWGHRALPPLHTREVHPTPQKIACGGSPPLCSYPSRSKALCAPLCSKFPYPSRTRLALPPLHGRNSHAIFARGVRLLSPVGAHHCPRGLPTPWGLTTAGSPGSDSFTPADSKSDSESFFAGVMPSSRTVSILRTRLPFPSNS